MATTISPSLGHAPLVTQEGTGTTPGYDAIDRRRLANAGLQEGVMEATSYEVTQRAAGVNMSVDIAANATPAASGIAALVQGDAVTGQGLYPVPAHTAIINEAISAAHASLPRVDRVVLEVLDNVHDASGSNLARVRVIDGTATAGATLDNLTGAAAVPSSCLLLADVHVPAADTTISNSQIRDRRKWARGAYVRIARSSGATVYGTSSTSDVAIDSTNLNPRIECSGVPLRVSFAVVLSEINSAGYVTLQLWQDGVLISGTERVQDFSIVGVGAPEVVVYEWTVVPAAGSHRFGPAWRVVVGSAQIAASATSAAYFTVEEIVRQNTPNNATTTG